MNTTNKMFKDFKFDEKNLNKLTNKLKFTEFETNIIIPVYSLKEKKLKAIKKDSNNPNKLDELPLVNIVEIFLCNLV